MRSLLLLIPCFAISAFRAFKSPVDDTRVHTNLVWSDEFDYEGIPDPDRWGYDIGRGCNLPCGCGWGNNELQFYTKENSQVKDGNLIITLNTDHKLNYSSSRLHTKNTASWKYGTLEIRAKTAKGLGAWSAIWMLPTENLYGGWPKSGEIDIMEQVGYAPDSVWSAAHVESFNGMIGNNKHGRSYIEDVSDDFHIYKLVWTEDWYETYIDGNLNFRFENQNSGTAQWPFDQSFHLILNVAYGGNWGGAKGTDDTSLPMQMEVDYVRVYQ